MKSNNYVLVKYEADDGKVFDWKNLEEHKSIDEDGNEVQDHLYAKVLFIGHTDSIDNYVEIDDPIIAKVIEDEYNEQQWAEQLEEEAEKA